MGGGGRRAPCPPLAASRAPRSTRLHPPSPPARLQVNQAQKKRAQLALVSHVMLAYENVLKVQKYHNFEVRGQNLYTAKIKHMGQEVRLRARRRH